jgi:8-oxo-dGTP pyrophosphatase MutT (NUDIX family)
MAETSQGNRIALAVRRLLHVEAATRRRPFCAGVAVANDGALYLCIAKPARWRTDQRGRVIIPITWVGGGQEPNETIRECARREGSEELGCPVTLTSSPTTHFCVQGEMLGSWRCQDLVAPLLLDAYRTGPGRYKAGLPAGPIVYVAVYSARIEGVPGTGDVPGLLRITRRDVDAVRNGLTVEEARRLNLLVAENLALPAAAQLCVNERGPERCLLTLWCAGVIVQQG